MLINISFATNFYVSNSTGNDSNNGLSPSTPWKTISKVNSSMGSFNADDSILFKRGDTFTGRLLPTRSGTIGHPIYFGKSVGFGSGADPIFTVASGNVIGISNRSFLKFNGIKITDLNMDSTNRHITANIDYAVSLSNSPSNYFSNMDVSLVGIAFEFDNGSTADTLDQVYLHNGRMVVNTPIGISATDDYGANGVVFESDNNVILNSRFDGLWAYSYDFGEDGGAVEVFGGFSGNKVLYSYVNNCNGICEFGTNGGGNINNTLVAYCQLTNNGLESYFSATDVFASQVSNTQYFNNTIVESVNTFAQASLFGFGGTPVASTAYNLRNNIFYITDGASVMRVGNPSTKYDHQNNVYKLSGGSTVGYTLGASEVNTTSQVFTDVSAPDPKNWNFTLPQTSVAVNKGQDLGFTHDIINTPITGNPDAGAYESVNIVLTIDSCIFTYGTWQPCISGKETRSYYKNNHACLGDPPIDSIIRNCQITPFVQTIVYDPKTKQLYVNCTTDGIMVIYNTAGQDIYQYNYSANGSYTNINPLPRGVYVAATYNKSYKFYKR